MSAKLQRENVAVVCDENGVDADAMRAFRGLHSLGDARWYRRAAVDDVDRSIRGGAVGRVVFPRQGVLLEAIWSGAVDFEAWREADVRIDLVEQAASAVEQQLATIAASWRQWRRRQRRQQAVAGVVLSAAAVGTAFVLIYLAG